MAYGGIGGSAEDIKRRVSDEINEIESNELPVRVIIGIGAKEFKTYEELNSCIKQLNNEFYAKSCYGGTSIFDYDAFISFGEQYAILNSTYTADMYVWGDYCSTYVVPAMEMMEELPGVYTYDLITDSQIENGDLITSGYKALILPNAISLSDLECSQICNFVEQGGLIFATAQTGTYEPGVDWRSGFGLDCLGVTYKSSGGGYVWNMDIVENCSPLVKGVFEKSESGDDIIICGGDYLVLVDLKTGVNITTLWKDTLYGVSTPAFIESNYGSGHVVYCTGEFFEGWKYCKEEPTWGSKDSEPCRNAEKFLWNALYNYANTPISNLNLSHWWLISQMREQTNLIINCFNPKNH